MAINVNDLPEYVADNRNELLTKAALGAETLDYIDTILNVKHKTNLHILSSTIQFQNGKECGFNAQGEDKFSNRTLEVIPIKVNKSFCDRDLIEKWTNQDLLIQAGRETLPFEQIFMEENNKAIARKLDEAIWQAKGNSDYLDGFRGFTEYCQNGATVELPVGSTEADLVDAMYAAIPTAVLANDPIIFVSYTFFRKYIMVLNSTCCANRPIVDANTVELRYIGDSRVIIKPVVGLENSEWFYAGSRHNFIYGTDIEDSQNAYKLWYSDDDDLFKYKVLFNAGVQVAFPDEVVRGRILTA